MPVTGPLRSGRATAAQAGRVACHATQAASVRTRSARWHHDDGAARIQLEVCQLARARARGPEGRSRRGRRYLKSGESAQLSQLA